MRARVTYKDGKWWCKRMEITGCGDTPKEAWDDMWELYRKAIHLMRKPLSHYTKPRAG